MILSVSLGTGDMYGHTWPFVWVLLIWAISLVHIHLSLKDILLGVYECIHCNRILIRNKMVHACFHIFLCYSHSDWKDKYIMVAKAYFSIGWPVWPPNSAFILVIQVHPIHLLIRTICFYSVIIKFLFSDCLPPLRWRALLLWAYGLEGRDKKRLTDSLGYIT